MDKEKLELYCSFCKYTAANNVNWFKHLETEKHKRLGKKKDTTCNMCPYTSTSHWNIKIHKLYIHSTIDERKACKYYCNTCDSVFLCSAYYNKHMSGKVHMNKVKVKESLEELEKLKNINI
jgi:hypothetical protein